MSKSLTASSVLKQRPAKRRQEIPDAGCRGLFLIIQPSGAKSWALRYRRPDGRPAKLVLGSVHIKINGTKEPNTAPVIGGHLTLAAAHRLVTELRHEIAQGRDPAAIHIENKRRIRRLAGNSAANTFASAARQFVDSYTVPKKGRKPRRWREIAKILGLDYPPTGGAPTIVKGGLVDRWAQRPITEIDAVDIHGAIDESRRLGIPGLAARNAGASDARGRKVADALGSMFKWLLRCRSITVNPCVSAYRPHAPEARERVLSESEIVKFWAASGTLSEPFGVLLKLLLLTGCRLNEVAGMRRGELEDGKWTIPGTRTKNSRPHVVPIAPFAAELISSVPRLENSEFLFTTTGRSPVSGWSKTKLRLDAAMGNPPAWRLHDIRRTAATGMAELGIPPHIVEACLNHVSGAKAGVAGTYNRAVYAAEKKLALERWATHIHLLTSGKPAKVVRLRQAMF
jgi:integrase